MFEGSSTVHTPMARMVISFYTCIANFIHGCILISTYVINHNESTFFKGFRERGASEFRTS
ncbi:hypothetical protein ACE6H2_016939 [Prunus campanulata]